MAEPLAFVCFDPGRNQDEYQRFIEEKSSCPVQFEVDAASLEKQLAADDWARLVRGKIGRCDFMVVLLGPDPVASEFINEQIQMARSVNVPFFGVYPNASEPPHELPNGLPANRTIPWDWRRIGEAIHQLLAEGKNYKFK